MARKSSNLTETMPSVASNIQMSPTIGRKRPRVGVIVACLGEYDSKALRYAILRLNTAQSFVEYEIVYDVPEDHEFVARTRYGGVVRTSYIKHAVACFEAEVVRRQSEPFKNTPQTPCDRYLALCNCQLESGVYLFKPGNRMRTMMVGSWKTYFAPPSLLEFIVDICIKQGIAEAFGAPRAHMPSRGCIFDYNEILENTRNGVLIGHVCEECTTHMSSRNPNWNEIKKLTGGRWLGDPSDPFSPYCELQRLGFKAFKASGVRDSFFRRFMDTVPLQVIGKLVEHAALGAGISVGLFLGSKGLIKAFGG
ncbi:MULTISPECIES: hypothetical protein [Rhizobium]|uniref:hypothetical protein n=1 Tax=Rhizobium TaxID=379 RepID=UPI001030FFB6|nr:MULTISPECIES: hypothetical protein [Rhizobium]TBD43441.1 hypothetical protein ELH19_15025 [Rhizobium ruizarguesonis]TBY60637.1 hypothetical protein E0H39_23725 [Rhizobium leguminosarum bv. viciae]